MKVKELIDRLQQYDPDELVTVWDCAADKLANVALVEERFTVRNLNGEWGYDGTRYVEITSGGIV